MAESSISYRIPQNTGVQQEVRLHTMYKMDSLFLSVKW
jgi:hypothetical protein